MKQTLIVLKEQLLRERGRLCEHCLIRPATDMHHCLIRRDVRFPELDSKENFMMVCHYCHMRGDVDAKAVRELFWHTQCRRYGTKHMHDWLAALPLKVKPVFRG